MVSTISKSALPLGSSDHSYMQYTLAASTHVY